MPATVECMGDTRSALTQEIVARYAALVALVGVASDEHDELERSLAALPATDLAAVATVLALLVARPNT